MAPAMFDGVTGRWVSTTALSALYSGMRFVKTEQQEGGISPQVN